MKRVEDCTNEELVASAVEGDFWSEEELIIRNTKMVHKIANDIRAKYCIPESFFPYNDMIAEGQLAIYECIGRYDPEKGILFSTYIYPRIAGKIKDAYIALQPEIDEDMNVKINSKGERQSLWYFNEKKVSPSLSRRFLYSDIRYEMSCLPRLEHLILELSYGLYRERWDVNDLFYDFEHYYFNYDDKPHRGQTLAGADFDTRVDESIRLEKQFARMLKEQGRKKFTRTEIAELLSVTPKTVDRYKQKGIKKLQEVFAEKRKDEKYIDFYDDY